MESSSRETRLAKRALVLATIVTLMATMLAPRGYASGAGDGRNKVIPGPLSADGRITAWVTAEPVLADDTNGEQDVYARDLVTGETWLVSVASDGTQGNRSSSDPAFSADGRYIAFASEATNLIPGNMSNARGGIYVRDLTAGTTERVSASSSGEPANQRSFDAVMSSDGRYVVFQTGATNLDPRDTNRYPDIYLHDREDGSTNVVSVDSQGSVQDGGALYPDLSPDGRYVAFQTYAPLAPSDTNTLQDVYVHDADAGETEIVSVSTRGTQGGSDARTASISEGGRYVAFTSTAALVPQDTNAASDVFVRDRLLDTTRRVTVTSSGAEAQSGNAPFTPGSWFPSISPEGRFVAFQSDAPNLISDDTSDWDVFVHDLATGATTLGARGLDGSQPNNGAGVPELGIDGRYMSFISTSTNLVPEPTQWGVMVRRDRGPSAGIGAFSVEVVDDAISAHGWTSFAGTELGSARDPSDDAGEQGLLLGSELTGASIALRPELGDLFVRWELEHLPALSTQVAIAPAVVHAIAFEVDGLPYEIRAARVDAGRAPSFGLFQCDSGCTKVAALEGGYGESGMEITASVPLPSFAVDDPGAILGNVTAFSGPGAPDTGVLQRLDEALLGDMAVPHIDLMLGVAPAGTNPNDVSFDSAGNLSEGVFSAELPIDGLRSGNYEVWARGCFGVQCGIASAPVTIESTQPGPTELRLTSEGEGDKKTLVARLVDVESLAGIPGRPVDFYSGGVFIGSAFTDSAGVASIAVRPGHRGKNRTYTAIFTGDDSYLESSDEVASKAERDGESS